MAVPSLPSERSVVTGNGQYGSSCPMHVTFATSAARTSARASVLLGCTVQVSIYRTRGEPARRVYSLVCPHLREEKVAGQERDRGRKARGPLAEVHRQQPQRQLRGSGRTSGRLHRGTQPTVPRRPG